jgi:hypothetical protein
MRRSSIIIIIIGVIIVSLVIFLILNKFVVPIPKNIRRETTLPETNYSFDVDVVVTWVDASDQHWIDEKNKYLEEDNRMIDARPNHRYNTYEQEPDLELCLCLRLILKHLPWVRTIHVVTSRPQIPDCLREGGILQDYTDKIRIVYHDEIYKDTQSLPVFNSVSIETQLHRIPSLSEQYIYFNDDFMVAKPLPKSWFFTSDKQPVVSAARWVRVNVLDTLFGGVHHHLQLNNARIFGKIVEPMHSPQSMTKTIMNRCEETYPDLFDNTMKSKFKSSTDLFPMQFALTESLYHGDSVFIDKDDYPIKNKFSRGKRRDTAKIKDYHTICINDASLDTQQSLKSAVNQLLLET